MVSVVVQSVDQSGFCSSAKGVDGKMAEHTRDRLGTGGILPRQKLVSQHVFVLFVVPDDQYKSYEIHEMVSTNQSETTNVHSSSHVTLSLRPVPFCA